MSILNTKQDAIFGALICTTIITSDIPINQQAQVRVVTVVSTMVSTILNIKK